MPWTLRAATLEAAQGDCPLAERVATLAREQSLRGVRAPGRFGGASEALALSLPSRFEGLSEHDAHRLSGLWQLLESHRGPLERELGTSFRRADAGDKTGPRWFVGPTRCNPELAALGLGEPAKPIARRLIEQRCLITDAPLASEIFESLSLLRTLTWVEADTLEAAECDAPDAAFLRVAEEVAHTWPSFRLQNLDWLSLCRRHARYLTESNDLATSLQELVAELGDAHTAVRKTDAVVPCSIRGRIVHGELILHEVPEGSAAWRAGAREGFRLLDLDLESGWRRHGATPHHRPFAVAARLLAGARGEQRPLAAVGPEGQTVRWIESYDPEPPEASIAWHRLPSGAGYLRIRQWPSSRVIADAVDAAFEQFAGAPGLVVDLRGNPGGALSVALPFRDRFVRERTLMGTTRFTAPDGELAEAEAIWAEPAPAAQRWPGPVCFLTDPATYSASEDLLLGLQGLSHVRVIGAPSGGGSGQARSLRLVPGYHLTVSSCLTFDRDGRCIEGAGITVDRFVPLEQHTHGSWTGPLLAVTNGGW
jgi:carboxyl-terminal processing protease